jgi:hypothetical protein
MAHGICGSRLASSNLIKDRTYQVELSIGRTQALYCNAQSITAHTPHLSFRLPRVHTHLSYCLPRHTRRRDYIAQACRSICLAKPHLFVSKELTLAMLQFTLCRIRLSARRICAIAQPLSRVSSPSALHLRSKCRVHATRRRRETSTQSPLQTWSSAPTNTRSSMRSSVACISLRTMYV